MNMNYIEDILKAIESMDYERALELIDEHRDEHEFEPEFITAQAILCLQTQEFEVARDLLLAGIDKHPDNADLLFNLGYTYHSMSDGKKALEYYMKASEQTEDADFINEIMDLCAEVESSPELMGLESADNDTAKKVTEMSVKTQDELHAMNFDIAGNAITPEKIRFLLRRIEFGVEKEKAEKALKIALNTGEISKESYENIVNLSWVDGSRLNELKEMLNT